MPYRNDNNYVKVAGRTAARLARDHPEGAIFANQFDNVANRDIHAHHRARNLGQTDGQVDGFVSAIGTGGTLAGVALALRERRPDIAIALADVPGAAMHSYYTTGEAEGRGSSITEGIGQGRVTANLEGFRPITAFSFPTPRAWKSPSALLRRKAGARPVLRRQRRRRDPLAARARARQDHRHHVVRPRHRYQSRLFNPEFLRSKGLEPRLARKSAGCRAGIRLTQFRSIGAAQRLSGGRIMTLSIGSVAPDFTAETTEGTSVSTTGSATAGRSSSRTPRITRRSAPPNWAIWPASPTSSPSATRRYGLSIDKIGDHQGWMRDIKDVTGNDVDFPMIGDSDLKVAKLYNMLPADAGETSDGRTAANNATVRTVYIIGRTSSSRRC